MAGEPVTNIFTQAFWDYYIIIGGSGATLGLVALMAFSRSAHLKSLGRMSAIPGFFQINEPVIFGSPIVMNPTLFLPFVFVPVINAIVAYIAVHSGFVGMSIATLPWTTPALIGASWGAGWTFMPVVLVSLIFVMDIILYYPFFKMYERELLAQEEPKEETEAQATTTSAGATA